jgi:hypothetical protein
MNERRIGTTVVHSDASALILHCPALRAAGPALMLAMFGAACSVIAIASMVGLIGASSDAMSNLLAFAFAGVLVLPLFGIGALFIVIALWAALNALTLAVAAGGVRAERRWCGIPLSRRTLQADAITAIDSVRAARFTGIFSGARHYRLLARSAAGALVLADHLQGAAQTEEVKQLLIAALARPELAASGRSDHVTDSRETAGAA